jgi:iron complex transport system ATP-binding protein
VADPHSARRSGCRRRRVVGRVRRCALAQQAPVLLLDEPTTALDIGYAQQVMELVDQLRREDGLTVLSATHDLTIAAQSADRLLLLVDGQAAACGTPGVVLTEASISEHYSGARVRVLELPDGGLVVARTRRLRHRVQPDLDVGSGTG